tara:strand:+ start:612 stop:947 length:336 start_codon:yes stop_codon:yes gene_type:complete
MCSGSPDTSDAEEAARKRHEENMALQREQVAEQKRQFEISRQDQQNRYLTQRRESKAAPPPPPEKTAATVGFVPALDSDKKKGEGRKKYRSAPRPEGRSTSFAAKSLYIPT